MSVAFFNQWRNWTYWFVWCSDCFLCCIVKVASLSKSLVFSLCLFCFPLPTEKLAQAKEENLGMHQVLDQTLMELNNL